jgi:hypothetical protein
MSMPENQRLDLERILGLVTDAMSAAYSGENPDTAAGAILASKNPTALEVAAARRENQEAHGGGTPETLDNTLKPSTVPEAVVRMREMIDEILVAAERRLESDK